MSALEQEILSDLVFEKVSQIQDTVYEYFYSIDYVQLKPHWTRVLRYIGGKYFFSIYNELSEEYVDFLSFESKDLPGSFDLKNQLIKAANANLQYFNTSRVHIGEGQ